MNVLSICIYQLRDKTCTDTACTCSIWEQRENIVQNFFCDYHVNESGDKVLKWLEN